MNITLSQKDVNQVKLALVAGIEVAAGARAKADYYHSRAEQIQAVQETIGKLYSIGKELPLIVAVQPGANGFFIQEALLNEFKQSTRKGRNIVVSPEDWFDSGVEERAIWKAIENLENSAGVPYVLRMFCELKERKINNGRSKRIALTWILNHPRLEFLSIKYHDKVRDIFQHCIGKTDALGIVRIINRLRRGLNGSQEIIRTHELNFINDRVLKYSKVHPTNVIEMVLLYAVEDTILSDTRLFSQLAGAHNDVFSAPDIPIEVLEGFLSDKRHPQHEQWKTSRDEMRKRLREKNETRTATQAVRQTKSDAKLSVQREVKLEEADPIALMKTLYENGTNPELINAIENAAKKLRYRNFPYERIGIVLDLSPSMRGHSAESKNTPRAIAEFTRLVLWRSTESKTTVEENLARGFLEIMRDAPETQAVFVLSDGYENKYDGMLRDTVAAYRRLTSHDIPVYHISPVGAAESGGRSRSLGEGILSLNADYRSLPTALQANALAADIRLWLANQIRMLAQEN